MNAVAQVLRLIAIVGALAAGYFYYQTNLKMLDLSRQNASLTNQVAQLKKDSTDVDARNQDFEKQVDSLKQKFDQNEASLKETSVNLVQVNADLTAAKRDGTAKTAQIQDLNGKLSALTQRQADYDALRQKNTALEQDKASLQSKLNALLSGVTRSSGATADSPGTAPTAVVAMAPISAKILEIDSSSGLIVLGAGTKGGLKSNIQLVLQKSGNIVGRVQVTDAQPDLAVGVVLQGSSLKNLAKGDVVDLVQL